MIWQIKKKTSCNTLVRIEKDGTKVYRDKKKFHTVEELSKLNTKRFLAFHKKDKKAFYRFQGGKYCECCGELYSEIYPFDTYYVDEVPKIGAEWKEYLKQIKEILDTREHIE